MQSVSIADTRWEQAFPHIVSLRQDEQLDGMILRCDEANGWESGTIATLLLHTMNTKKKENLRFFHLVVPPSPQTVHTLSHWLAFPENTLLEATYYHELARLYDRADITYDSTGIGTRFHFCPACISESRLLRRVFALPHIACCPIHHLQLVYDCHCYENGSARSSIPPQMTLQTLLKVGEFQCLYTSGSRPFTCPACGLDWGKFPRIPAEPARLALDQRFFVWYDFFLTQGTPAVIEQTMRRIERVLKRQGRRSIQHLDKTVSPFKVTAPAKTALGKLVETLVSIGIRPPTIADP